MQPVSWKLDSFDRIVGFRLAICVGDWRYGEWCKAALEDYELIADRTDGVQIENYYYLSSLII